MTWLYTKRETRDDMWSWCVANISTNGSCAYTYISRVTISKSKWCLSCSSDQPQIKQEIGYTAKKDKGLCPTMDWAYTKYFENTIWNCLTWSLVYSIGIPSHHMIISKKFFSVVLGRGSILLSHNLALLGANYDWTHVS